MEHNTNTPATFADRFFSLPAPVWFALMVLAGVLGCEALGALVWVAGEFSAWMFA